MGFSLRENLVRIDGVLVDGTMERIHHVRRVFNTEQLVKFALSCLCRLFKSKFDLVELDLNILRCARVDITADKVRTSRVVNI